MLGPDVFDEKIQPIKNLFTVSFVNLVKAKIEQRYLAWIEALYKRDNLKKLKSLAKSV